MGIEGTKQFNRPLTRWENEIRMDTERRTIVWDSLQIGKV